MGLFCYYLLPLQYSTSPGQWVEFTQSGARHIGPDGLDVHVVGHRGGGHRGYRAAAHRDPSFIAGLQKSGIGLVLVGLVAAVLPHAVAILFGRYVLRMNPLILLGACSGAGTMTRRYARFKTRPRASSPRWATQSPYAVGNIVLTAWGPVIVALMSIGK